MLENWDCRLTAIRNRAVSTSQSCIVYRTTFSFSALSTTTRIQHNKTVWDSTNSNAKSTSLRCSGQRECNLSVWSRTSQNQLSGADIAAYCQRSPEKSRVNFSALSGTDCSHTAYSYFSDFTATVCGSPVAHFFPSCILYTVYCRVECGIFF